MTACSSIIEDLISTLSENKGLSNVEFMREFPTGKKDSPLMRPTVTVGADRVFITCADQVVKIKAGKAPTTVRAKLTLCVPKLYRGIDCYGFIDSIITGLGDLTESHQIIEIESEELRYSTSLGVLVAPISVTFFVGDAY